MNARTEELKAKLAAAPTPRERIDALNALAWEFRNSLDGYGSEYAKTAYELAQAEQYQRGIAESLVNQCQFLFSGFVDALSMSSRALAIFEQLDDRGGQCRALYTLCWAFWAADDFVQSLELGLRAQKLAKELGDKALEAEILNNLGLTYKRSGNYELAYVVYSQALEYFRAVCDRDQEGKLLINIALACAAEGKYDRALTYAHEYGKLGLGEPRRNAYHLLVLGQIYAGKKEYDQALHFLQQVVSFASEHVEMEQSAEVALQAISQVYIDRGEPDLAIEHLKQGLAVAEKIQSNLYVYRFHEMLSQVYESRGDINQALAHYKKFHAVKEIVFNDKNTSRRQALEIQHQTEIARREAEIFYLRNVELEQEILERKRLQEELRQQAITDELTGVFNRRYFLDLARSELKRAVRFNHPASVALIDLDHFKYINDTYGHTLGDQTLIALAKTCQSHIRSIDVFARFGGDEFALLLPETDGNTALLVVERIRSILTDKPMDIDGTPISLTFSAGVASLEAETDSVDTLIAHSDQALYRSKLNGRNCVSL